MASVDLCCTTRTTPVHGRTSPNTEIHGGKVSKRGFQRRKRMLESRLHARERRGKNAQPLRTFPQGTSAPPATETAAPGSGYTVIQDPAQIPSANHRLFETRMPLSLPNHVLKQGPGLRFLWHGDFSSSLKPSLAFSYKFSRFFLASILSAIITPCRILY